jgi:cellulose synthase/poly-beta-1,6-N-acetylglucosamine synthase-like glycosyltransferase
MKPDVSVVIPSYERPGQTARAVWSALQQPGVRVEVVVVDDASPTPLSLPERLVSSGHVRVLRLPENRGAAGARNAGVEASSSDVVAFLDSDDFFLPDTLAQRLAFFSSQDDTAPFMCAAGVWRWSPPGNAVLAMPVEADDLESLCAGCWYFPGSTALFSRKVWDLVGPLTPSLRRLEDLEWGIRLGLAGGRLIVSPSAAAVVTRSRPAGWRTVAAASEAILASFGLPSGQPLPPAPWRRLQAYLDLEKANAARGEGRYASTAVSLLCSFAHVPRLRLHQRRWWTQRRAEQAELAWIAALAANGSGQAED